MTAEAAVRLQRYLSQAGVAARRKAEDLITAGRVTVNGKVVRELGTKVDPDKDRVAVDGQGVHPEEHFYLLFNKPKGCITAVTDDRGRMTVMDYLPNLPARVAPVGRLDFYSEGVLLLTNDGELASRLLSAKHHVPKTYHVKVRGDVAAKDLEALRAGVRLDDGTITQPAEISLLPGESRHTWIAVTLYEGKQRQIHRMLETRGYQVDKLQRVAFGNLTFHGLRVGDARELDQLELNELRELVGLDKRAVARGRWQARREDTDIPRRARTKAADEGTPIAREAPRARNVDPHRKVAEPEAVPPRREPPRREPPRRDDARRSGPPPRRDDDRRPRAPRADDARRSGPPRRDDARPAAPRRDDARRSGPPRRPEDRHPRGPRRGEAGRDDRRAAPPRRDDDRRAAPPRRDDDRRPAAPRRDDRRSGPPRGRARR